VNRFLEVMNASASECAWRLTASNEHRTETPHDTVHQTFGEGTRQELPSAFNQEDLHPLLRQSPKEGPKRHEPLTGGREQQYVSALLFQ
jgi:hypothetical protein